MIVVSHLRSLKVQKINRASSLRSYLALYITEAVTTEKSAAPYANLDFCCCFKKVYSLVSAGRGLGVFQPEAATFGAFSGALGFTNSINEGGMA